MVGGDGRTLVVFPLVSGVDHVDFPAQVRLRVALKEKRQRTRVTKIGGQTVVDHVWLGREGEIGC